MKEQIKKAIEISRLNIEQDEFSEDIISILEMFDELEEVNVEDIELEILPIKVKNQFREDRTYKQINESEDYFKIKSQFNPDKERISIGPKLK